MLHNSLHRRDELRATNANPLALKRRDVHRNVGRRPDAKPTADQFALEGAWAIATARGGDAERLVADDATDFLKWLDVAIDPKSTNGIHFEVGSSEAGFRTVAEPGRIEVHAASAASLWAGWVHLENEIRAAGGPILRRGEVARQPAWDVQIAPPTWGANYAVPDLSPEYLGDDTFRALAHQGADGMFVYGDWLLYATGTSIPEIDHPDAAKHIDMLRAAARRAAGYGVKLYFVPVSPKLRPDHAAFAARPSIRGARLQTGTIHCLCSSDETALKSHADVFGNLFRAVPDLGGLILIIGGESYYHCFMRSANTPVGATNCPRCKGRLAEDVIANLLKVTADAAHAHAPKAHVAAWPYSAQAFWSTEPHQLRLIGRLPDGVALLSEIDKDQVLDKRTPGGTRYRKAIWDYSIESDQPSDRIVAQAQGCARRNRELFIKTETAHGIELLHLPYVPSITRSARRWQGIRALRPRGVLQRWGFVGMFDSAAERIGFQARWDPDFTPESASNYVARQLFGPAADAVVHAWRAFDEAVGHIPMLTTGGYYIGPMFLGPAHPLPMWTGETPAAFRGSLYYLTESDATFTPPRPRGGDDLTLTSLAKLAGGPPIDVIEDEFTAARDASATGHEILSNIALDPLPPTCREEVVEQQAVGEYLYHTFRTTVNVIRFLRAKESASASKPAQVEIAKDEHENTKTSREVYARAPWLNHALRLDVGCPDSLVMIDEKLKLLEAFLQS